MDADLLRDIRQQKFNCLAAKSLHSLFLVSFNRKNKAVDLLALAVPALYVPVRYIAKGTPAMIYVEAAWECLAALLLVLAFLKIVYGWQGKAETHSKLLGENIAHIAQSNFLVAGLKNNTTTPDGARWFLMQSELDKADAEALADSTVEQRRYAYREALKEIDPSSPHTVCEICGASPWNYVPGSCQTCGNTPTKGASPNAHPN